MNTTVYLTNPGATATTPRLSITEEDLLQVNGSDVIDPSTGDDISDIVKTKNNFWTGTIAAGGTAQAGPDFPFTNTSIIQDSITQGYSVFPNFSGTGTVPMTYSNFPGYSLSGGSANASPFFAISTNITLTYYFCSTGTLAIDILNFTAVKNSDATVALNWLTANEVAGRSYTVQLSAGNGADFANLTTVPALASRSEESYEYTYNILPTDKGQLYFRLKMEDIDGSITYSPIRVINLSPNAGTLGFTIYPNPPSDYINLTLPGDSRSWQVDIVAADGNLVQRNEFANTSLARVNFSRRMANGTYFVRATNPLSGEHHTGSFVIAQ